MLKIVKANNRHRYIGFIIKSNNNIFIDRDDLINELKSNCKLLFNRDFKDLGLRLIRFNYLNGIVKCNHIEKDNTIKLLTSIKNVSNINIEIETLGTSGTIKGLIKKHMS